MEAIAKIISSILATFYQAFFYAALLSVAVMFVYKLYPNLKTAMIDWLKWFKADAQFRRVFFLVLYTVMILFRTLLNRNMWANPLSNIIGVWGLHNAEGELTTEAVENFLLFMPFTIALLHILNGKKIDVTAGLGQAVWFTFKATLIFTTFIELTQLFLRLGTVQLSDFFYNTLGGVIGCLIYWLYLKIRQRFD